MNKIALFVASLLMSISSFAQWAKPAAPAVAPMSVDEECYLYNKGADGFLLGANDWETRASVSPTLGPKCTSRTVQLKVLITLPTMY